MVIPVNYHEKCNKLRVIALVLWVIILNSITGHLKYRIYSTNCIIVTSKLSCLYWLDQTFQGPSINLNNLLFTSHQINPSIWYQRKHTIILQIGKKEKKHKKLVWTTQMKVFGFPFVFVVSSQFSRGFRYWQFIWPLELDWVWFKDSFLFLS